MFKTVPFPFLFSLCSPSLDNLIHVHDFIYYLNAKNIINVSLDCYLSLSSSYAYLTIQYHPLDVLSHLKFNMSKTEFIIFYPKLVLSSVPILAKDTTIYLGVIKPTTWKHSHHFLLLYPQYNLSHRSINFTYYISLAFPISTYHPLHPTYHLVSHMDHICARAAFH